MKRRIWYKHLYGGSAETDSLWDQDLGRWLTEEEDAALAAAIERDRAWAADRWEAAAATSASIAGAAAIRRRAWDLHARPFRHLEFGGLPVWTFVPGPTWEYVPPRDRPTSMDPWNGRMEYRGFHLDATMPTTVILGALNEIDRLIDRRRSWR